MLLSLILLLQAGAPGASDTVRVFSGRQGQTAVAAPRLEAAVEVDGVLDEPAWGQAAQLRDFSQFDPQDGIPAADSTEVLVWYSPTAIHFGIRAREAHGEVHATLANRDRITADDYVMIMLGTFNDGRQATVFGVNPLGIQLDGALVESGRTAGGFGAQVTTREPADLSPDFTWQSKGRLVPGGYEIEVRVPFKSIRFQPGKEQTWNLQIVRRVQHSGYEDTWAPARRATASFLGQAGRLVGLSELRRGVVLDINPEITSNVSGLPGAGGTYDYSGGSPQVGGNVRWGITNNLNLNGAVNPDFSQVESDAGQVNLDPRSSLFFAEKRPFFLDGIEQFSTPTNLIYTRRIVQPTAAVKLTGQALGSNIAFLSAMDDRDASATGSRPFYNLLRVQKDVGGRSRLGVAYTDKVDGDNYNRVAAIDGRVVLGGSYSATFQLGGSRNRSNGVTTTAPLWLARVNNNGRRFGFRSTFFGVDDEFRAGSGFFNRVGVVQANVSPYYAFYGKPGSFIERFTPSIALDGTWQYDKFVGGDGIQDQKLHFITNSLLRGGWNVGLGFFYESFGYDEELYSDYFLQVSDGSGGVRYEPFVGQPTIHNDDVFLQVNTPQFKSMDASLFLLVGNDENFPEWASGRLTVMTANLNLRPSEQLRVGITYNWQQANRRNDGTIVHVDHIPRVKVEYQLARPLFVRLIGEYAMSKQDSLRDNSRTEAPIYFSDGAGGFVRAGATRRNDFRTDVLVAYQPTPGTVVFAGYGRAMEDPDAFSFRNLRRTRDGFFAKVSYLFRL